MNALSQSVNHRVCPACGTPAPRAVLTVPAKKDIDGNALRLVTCPHCWSVFQPVVPSLEALARWYIYMGDHAGNVELTPFKESRLELLMCSLGRNVSGKRLLEVGCGGGLLLRVAQRLGWDVYGTEISPSCCELLREWLSERLWQGELPSAPFPLDSFDLIIFMEVLEHLQDPLGYLHAAYRLLRSGGMLYLSTPNYQGLSRSLLGHRWHVIGDEHLNYFNPSSLELIVRRAGFKVASVRTTGLDLVANRIVRLATASDTKESTHNMSRRSDKHRLIAGAIRFGNLVLSALRLGDTLRLQAIKM